MINSHRTKLLSWMSKSLNMLEKKSHNLHEMTVYIQATDDKVHMKVPDDCVQVTDECMFERVSNNCVHM